MTDSQLQCIEIWGDFACFTRPELKVERLSYPVITPSAARGIFSAIYLRPKEFWWQVRQIEVLAPVSFIALRRNELKQPPILSKDLRRAAGISSNNLKDKNVSYRTLDQRDRTQRQTMALKKVHYRVSAEVVPLHSYSSDVKFYEHRFQSRVRKGQCIYQPYLGCREFAAYFSPPDWTRKPQPLTTDLGLVLYDVFHLSVPRKETTRPSVSLFHAEIKNGVLSVPPYLDNDVLKPSSI